MIHTDHFLPVDLQQCAKIFDGRALGRALSLRPELALCRSRSTGGLPRHFGGWNQWDNLHTRSSGVATKALGGAVHLDPQAQSRNYVAAVISLALQWILMNGSEGYLFSPFTGPRMSPISLYFKDSVSIDTGLSRPPRGRVFEKRWPVE
ncbi:hypothetical protein TNCV_1604091 [Trichonephila clavipes]|nr:hypothetical protein TNCV_1604091 [Trichonephila clavipes]